MKISQIMQFSVGRVIQCNSINNTIRHTLLQPAPSKLTENERLNRVTIQRKFCKHNGFLATVMSAKLMQMT